MSSNKDIIYALIGYKSKKLVDYTPYQGSFDKTCIKYLKSIKPNTSGYKNIDDYIIIYINNNNFTYLIMANSDFPRSTASSCLKSIQKEFETSFPNQDFENIDKSVLNQEFKEKLKLKIEYYNQNRGDDNSSENFDEMFKEDDALISIDTISDLSKSTLSLSKSNIKSLINDEINVVQETNKISKASKTKKIIILIIILLALIYFIIYFSCDSWTFQC